MARRMSTARERLEALEARAALGRDAGRRQPLADVLAVAGVSASEFTEKAAVLADPATDDAAAVAAGVWVSGVLARAARRMDGLPDLPDPIPYDPKHPEPPGPGWLTNGRHWHPGLAR